MTDNEINRRLANCYKAELLFLGPYEKFVTKDGRTIDYKDPAIFAENVEWLGENYGEVRYWKFNDMWYLYYSDGSDVHIAQVKDKNLRKAVALARIAAQEYVREK